MSSRPNVKKLARRNRFDALAAATQYHDWAQLRDGGYVDLGITVRREAVAALAESDDPRAVAVLNRALGDPAVPVRVGAVTALDRRLIPPSRACSRPHMSGSAPRGTTPSGRPHSRLCDPIRV